MVQWYWLDYAIMGVVGLSVITGLFRGFVKELIALTAWVLAIWLAFNYSDAFDPWLQGYVHDSAIRKGIAFIGILFAILIVGGVFNALLSFILKRSGLSGTDRLLGMGFGFVRGVFIVALVMLAVQMTSIPYQEYKQQSRLYAKFDPLVNLMSRFTPELIKKVNLERSDATSIDVS